MHIELFADSGDLDQIEKYSKDYRITGFTTNPTLMAKGGVTDYEKFAREAMRIIKKNKPSASISLEVFDDNPDEMIRQGEIIFNWGEKEGVVTYVKVPVLNVNGESNRDVISVLARKVFVNVTAVFTEKQVEYVSSLLQGRMASIISIFAGRIADTGVDPKGIFRKVVPNKPSNIDFLWASTREVFNIFEAEDVGADIITVTPDLLAKLSGVGKHLTQLSIETSQMFSKAAKDSGFSI